MWWRIQSTGRTIKPMRFASSGKASTGKSLHMPPSQYTCPARAALKSLEPFSVLNHLGKQFISSILEVHMGL